MSLPLARLNDDAPLVWLPTGAVTAGEFLGRAHALAAALGPPRAASVILCEDRYHFLLAFAATLLRGERCLLPPNRLPVTIEQVQRAHPDSRVLVDADVAAIEPGLVTGTGSVAADEPQVVLYTSGSTGSPSANPKTWRRLSTGSRLLAERLPLPDGPARLVATVPPQHMYGFETSILLPLLAGIGVDAGRPFFPQDVLEHLGAGPEPTVLVTTPLHMRACLEADLTWPRPAFVLSATAPLDPGLAAAAEAAWRAPVLEIYGSTETGAMATRRPAQDPRWQPLRDVRFSSDGDGAWVEGPQLSGPQRLADRLSLEPDGRFSLLGRTADLVNVAGKRASLADLNHKLLGIDGVLDGAFVLPEDNPRSGERLAAVVVAPALETRALQRALAQLVDPVFLPRPLYRVDRLPRNETGKLPRVALLALLAQLERTGP